MAADAIVPVSGRSVNRSRLFLGRIAAAVPVVIRINCVHEPAVEGDGVHVTVDRLWPRRLSKEAARIDLWLKDIAPWQTLRRWFGHDAGNWDELFRRYAAELRLAHGDFP